MSHQAAAPVRNRMAQGSPVWTNRPRFQFRQSPPAVLLPQWLVLQDPVLPLRSFPFRRAQGSPPRPADGSPPRPADGSPPRSAVGSAARRIADPGSGLGSDLDSDFDLGFDRIVALDLTDPQNRRFDRPADPAVVVLTVRIPVRDSPRRLPYPELVPWLARRPPGRLPIHRHGRGLI